MIFVGQIKFTVPDKIDFNIIIHKVILHYNP